MSELVHERGTALDGAGYESRSTGSPQGRAWQLTRAWSNLGASAVVLVTAMVFGFLARTIAAITLSPHVDEPSSVLAAHMVAERGLPILPSGTPYFQGVTLSYLLQPFIWLGAGEIQDLAVMRMLLVVAGTATVYISYRFARAITGSAAVGAVTALLIACDPVSVQWSAHVRMYGLLQLLTFALVWAYIRLLQGNTSWRQVVLVVGIFWLAVFTHAGGGSLLGAAMALAAFVVYRKHLFRQWRLLVALGASALGSATVMTLNKVLGTANQPVQESKSVPGGSFVGDNLLAPLASIKAIPRDGILQHVAVGVTLYWAIPGVIVAASTIIGGRYLLRKHAGDPTERAAIVTMLSFYWLPMLLVVAFTVSPEVRYLLHMHLLGYVFLAVLIVRAMDRALAARGSGWFSLAVLGRYAMVAAIALGIGWGLLWRLDNPVQQPDYNAAMAYVAEHHKPGEPIIITLPPVGYLSVDKENRDDVYFLAGSEGFTRADRYTRWSADGRLIDYWVGAQSIVSTRTLSSILEEYPNAWVIADDGRLDSDWISGTLVERVLRDTMFPAFRSEGGAVVYHSTPAEVREPEADKTDIEQASGVVGDAVGTGPCLPGVVQATDGESRCMRVPSAP